VLVIARHHDLLQQLGLHTIEGVKRFQGELVKNHKGRRDILRVRTSAGPLLYLKRNWRPYRKDGVHSLLTRGRVWSQSRTEWENSLALKRAGIHVAEPVAMGEQCGPLWEKFSFVLTANAVGEVTLDQFLRGSHSPPERRRVLDALADWVKKFHDSGFASPDLFTRHIFVSFGPPPQFCLIDMARLDQKERIPDDLRARDLAALHVTAPLRFLSNRERLRFLSRYGAGRDLMRRIERRAKYLLRRRKFRDFSATD
jgi:hypothetical protein